MKVRSIQTAVNTAMNFLEFTFACLIAFSFSLTIIAYINAGDKKITAKENCFSSAVIEITSAIIAFSSFPVVAKGGPGAL
jgi:hypothetical protein